MATLADTFLEDLEDDDDDDDTFLLSSDATIQTTNQYQKESSNIKTEQIDSLNVSNNSKLETLADDILFADMESMIDIDAIEIESKSKKEEWTMLDGTNVECVSDLLNSDRLMHHISLILKCMNQSGNVKPKEKSDYDLIVESNEMALEIDNHIIRIHKFVRDIYSRKFPELEEMVTHPIEYARVVQLIRNRSAHELTDLALNSVLSNPSVAMTVHISATTSLGKPLQSHELKRVLHASEVMLKLEKKKQFILEFIASRMGMIAPNVTRLVGSEIAAKLIALTGSISKLSQIPSCNLQVLGALKRGHSTYSQFNAHASAIPDHFGVIGHCELIRNTPVSMQRKALRLIAAKLALCARADAAQRIRIYNSTNSIADCSSLGVRLFAECESKILKWQEPPPEKPKRPLPIPDNKPRKKRGGKRYRKMRERYKVTETQRMQNRMAFNKAESEIIDGNGNIIGLGMLGSSADVGGQLRSIGGGRSTQNGKPTKLHKLHRRQLLRQQRLRMKAVRAGTVSGLHTSVVLTSVQGIELGNPEYAAKLKQKKQTYKYFDEADLFAKKQ